MAAFMFVLLVEAGAYSRFRPCMREKRPVTSRDFSVMVQQAASAEILFHVGAGAFLPAPAVTSTVLRLRPRT
jgi:16S rRNA A1518/A1519 N6-dimethyltransferase RsmA/KsgA/DIM1 with predicted DNA glycosylase/AP lyase activity